MPFFDRFRQPKPTETFANFLTKYPAGKRLGPISKNDLLPYESKLPQELRDFLLQNGHREFGGGLLTLINPKDYQASLNAWLGQESLNRIPIFRTAFGDLIYYRLLSNGNNDLAFLDIHYRQTPVLAYSWQDFSSQLVLKDDIMSELLKTNLYQDALKKCGPLSANDCYFFAPALALGGAEELNYLDKGDVFVHHDLLLTLI